jgi:hypothetical protein
MTFVRVGFIREGPQKRVEGNKNQENDEYLYHDFL